VSNHQQKAWLGSAIPPESTAKYIDTSSRGENKPSTLGTARARYIPPPDRHFSPLLLLLDDLNPVPVRVKSESDVLHLAVSELLLKGHAERLETLAACGNVGNGYADMTGHGRREEEGATGKHQHEKRQERRGERSGRQGLPEALSRLIDITGSYVEKRISGQTRHATRRREEEKAGGTRRTSVLPEA
jgi:hypothetical protein